MAYCRGDAFRILFNDESRIIEIKNVKVEDVSRGHLARGYNDVIEFDPSNSYILINDLQASHGERKEDVNDTKYEVSMKDVEKDGHENVKETEFNDDDYIEPEIYLDDLTNVSVMRKSKKVNAKCSSARFDFEQSRIDREEG